MLNPYIAKCQWTDDLAVMLDDQDGMQHAVIIFRDDGTFSRPNIPNDAALGIKVNKNNEFAMKKELGT